MNEPRRAVPFGRPGGSSEKSLECPPIDRGIGRAEKIGIAERLGGERVWQRQDADPGGSRGGDPLRRVFDREALPCAEPGE